ncbi:MAG: hypothetical protein ACE5EQ_12780 [Phycisphaerae bacterium]
MMTESNENQPLETKKFDRVQAAIWRQESGAGESKTQYYTFTLSRSYKNDQGQWCRVQSFTARDLPHMALAVDWAMRELLLKAE